jgi:hypothetical protein
MRERPSASGQIACARARRIWQRFYTPAHVAGLAWKVLRGGLVTPGLLARLLLAGIRGEWAKRWRRQHQANALPGGSDG